MHEVNVAPNISMNNETINQMFKRLWSRRLFRIYFETSALNHLIENVSYDAIRDTRLYQRRKNKEFFISPVTLWEIFASQDDKASDYLIFCAQQVFSKNMLATPSEIIVRFLDRAYPNNRVNYNEFCGLPIANLWTKMAKDTSVKFEYDKNEVIKKTNYIRELSKKITQIVKYPETDISDNTVEAKALADVINTYYQVLLEEGVFYNSNDKKTSLLLDVGGEDLDLDYVVLNKLIIFFVVLFMILRMDMTPSVIDGFWNKRNFEDQDLTGKLVFFFEQYPKIFKYGPFLQMAIVAYYQIKKGGRSRGLILDSYHALYSSYCDMMITADSGFQSLQEIPYFKKRLFHISDISIFETQFKK